MNNIYPKIFGWMFIGLLVTFITGYTVSLNETMLYNIFSNWINLIIIIIIEFAIAIYLTARIRKLSPPVATILFLLYSFITGLTFAVIFVVYNLSSIIWIFLVTAILFAIFAIVGYITKIDLTKIHTYLFMALLGVILLGIINAFVKSANLDMGLCIVSMIIFIGFIAYDTQKIKKLYGTLDDNNLAIIGAFQLYLDFINLFLDLLKLFGERKD